MAYVILVTAPVPWFWGFGDMGVGTGLINNSSNLILTEICDDKGRNHKYIADWISWVAGSSLLPFIGQTRLTIVTIIHSNSFKFV